MYLNALLLFWMLIGL